MKTVFRKHPVETDETDLEEIVIALDDEVKSVRYYFDDDKESYCFRVNRCDGSFEIYDSPEISFFFAKQN